jgi:ribosome-binding protein aMBF1 (putative translation factor)
LRFFLKGDTVVVDKIAHRRDVQKTKAPTENGAQYRTRNGRSVVILDAAEYERLRERADEWEPPLPEPDADGNYPALEYARASLARKIIRHRRRLGLSQAELARRAGIRLETLQRAESGKASPSVATVEKIDKALGQAEAR